MPSYQISLQPYSHQYHIKLTFIATHNTQVLSLPNWIPGSYMVRDFSRNIIWLKCYIKNNNTQEALELINFEQVTKNEWQIFNLIPGQIVEVHYSVYSIDLGIREAYLDQIRGFFNPTSLCLQVLGHEDLQHCITFENLPQNWQVATPLALNSSLAHNYSARNYSELIDSPFELGKFLKYDFTVSDIPHCLVLSGEVIESFDKDRFIHDIKQICQAHIKLFGFAPFDRYTFMLNLKGEIYTGLEHCKCTTLIAPFYALPSFNLSSTISDLDDTQDEYVKLLSLISHEYFHAWNVKLIKPKEFAPYDLSQENYTKLLWWFEGVTSYYEILILALSGVIDNKRFLQLLIDEINQVYKYEGVKVQTLANSSLTSWVKYYKQDANSPNSTVSYYTKGALFALCLDLFIRLNSNYNHSLDDVLKSLATQALKDQSTVTEEILLDEVNSLLLKNVNSQELFDKYVYGYDILPLQELLHEFGLELYSYKGNYTDTPKLVDSNEKKAAIDKELKQEFIPELGCKLVEEGVGYKVINVYANSNSYYAGLAPNDIIIAINKRKIGNLKKHLSIFTRGNKIILTIFRVEQLIDIEITLNDNQITLYNIKINNKDQLSNWLSSKYK